jgi:hypothetical protein
MESTEIKKPRERSKEYPQYDLKFCISLVEEIISKLGNRVSSLKQIAKAFNKSETHLSSQLSACRQYGLLEIIIKEGYKPTDLFLKITRGRTESIKRASLLEALQTPSIYANFINKHNGEKLPDDLPSIFYWDYKITEASKEGAAKVFRSNLDYLDVIGHDGKLAVNNVDEQNIVLDTLVSLGQETLGINTPKNKEDVKKTDEKIILNSQGSVVKKTDIKIGQDRFVTIEYPINITNEEADKLAKKILAILKDD